MLVVGCDSFVVVLIVLNDCCLIMNCCWFGL